MISQPRKSKELHDIERMRDEALRRALNTPPKQHKDMKKGKGKKQQDKPSTSQKQP